MKVCIFDTETTGLPDWKKPADDPCQPRMIQIAGLLIDDERQEIDSMVSMVRPAGWRMDDELAEKLGNGLTHQRLLDEGKPVLDVMRRFNELHDQADLLVAYNARFDLKIIRGERRRLGLADQFGAIPYFCPQATCTKLCAMGPSPAMRAKGMRWNKTVKLEQAYSHFFDEPIQDAHDALADCRSLSRVFWHLVDLGLVDRYTG